MLETGTRARRAREGMIHKYVQMSIFMLAPILLRGLYSRGGIYAEGRPSDIYFPFSSFTVTPLAEPKS